MKSRHSPIQQHHVSSPSADIPKSQITVQAHPLHKLVCSLKSGLPNEIDFAMHVSTLLANSDSLSWSEDYRLVDAICESLQVFTCVCDDQDGANNSCYCFAKFWRKLFPENNETNLKVFRMSVVPAHTLPQYMRFDQLTNHSNKDHTKIYNRIKHVAELIRQISLTTGEPSFKKRNRITNEQHTHYQHTLKKKKLCASGSLLKFAALLLFCDDIAFKDIGLDIVANVSPKLSKLSEINDLNSQKLIDAIHSFCLKAINQENGDIYTVNRCLEIVSKLLSSSSQRLSSKIAAMILENNLIARLEQLLTCQHDVTLFLSALECCYHISQHQPQLIIDSERRYLIKLLINLLNCDAQRYFTSSSLKRIKLIDERITMEENGNHHHPVTPLASAPVNSNPQPISTTIPNKCATPVQNSSQVLCRLLRILEFVCDWDGCKKTFTNPKQVYTHVFETHINSLPNEAMTSCLWSGPSGVGPGCRTKRPKYSLLTHLNDFHCNPAVLQQCAMRNQQLTTTGSTAIQPPIKPPEHPGYAPNAALLAIKRHAAVGLDLNGTNGLHIQPQSPLSISVRLTSALVLRNLASRSQSIQQALEGYEPVLCEICMANDRDESKTIAECLGLVIDSDHHKESTSLAGGLPTKDHADTNGVSRDKDDNSTQESSQADLTEE